jgi:asparagine synthase (glutamine-hydrolysing)
MCGIVGSVCTPRQTREWISNATTLISHRGPDDSGWIQNETMSLGMTRLAIVDIKGGSQPFVSMDNRYSLVFNGQIYNFKALRKKLEDKGHKFRSESDTEVILHGYIEYREQVVNHLEGMFAFAIWDSAENKLFLARDRFGEKPLSFAKISNGGLVFASEIKALLSHPDVSREPDLNSIQLMLNFGYVPSPRSAYVGIKKLPPAHFLVWQNNELSMTKYWDPPIIVQDKKSEKDLIVDLDELLLKSVELRMNSDRGIGAWLSGGVDSSLITYYMSQLQSTPVETFSAGFSNKAFDEAKFSLEVARHLKTSHNPLTIDEGIADVMEGVVSQLDEPFADSSFVATYILSKFTAEKRVVVLGGDGGDEAFGGYERYRLLKLVHGDSKFGGRTQLLSSIARLIPDSKFVPAKLQRARKVLSESADPFAQYQNMMSWIPEPEIHQLMGGVVDLDLFDWFEENLSSRAVANRGIEFSANLWDITSYLPGDLLPKVDMAAMSFGLEVRSPFLDSGIMSFGLSIPDSLRIKTTDPKYLLKQLARQKLPASIVDRPKSGFGIPRDEWLRGQLNGQLNEVLTKSNRNLAALVDIGVVESRLNSFNRGEKIDTEIWSLFMLGNWAQKWL